MIRYLITFFFSSILLSWCEPQNKGSIIKYSVCKTSNVCETNLKWNLITKLSLFFLSLCARVFVYHNENLFSFNNKQIVASQLLHLTQTLQNLRYIFKKYVTIFNGQMQKYMILHVSWHFLISTNFTYTRNYKICQSLKLKIWAYLKEHEIFPHFN